MADPVTFARISPATALDAEAVADAQTAMWRDTYGTDLSAEQLAEMAREAPARWRAELADPLGPVTWVAVRDGAVVGLARAVALGAGHTRPMELELLHVRADERGRRTGEHLLTMAIGDAPCLLWLPVGHDDGFLRRHGFVPDGAERTAEPGERLAGLRLRRLVR